MTKTKTNAAQPGLQLLHEFPAGERVVGICAVGARVIVATERGVYEVRGEEVQIAPGPLTWIPPEPAPPPKPARKKREAKPQTIVRDALGRITSTGPDSTMLEPIERAVERDRDEAAVRSARRRGWKRVIENERIPRGALRRTFGGVEMWRQM